MAERGAVQIVDPQTILDHAAMRLETYTLRRLNFENKFDVLQWLARRRLVKNSRFCEGCEINMSLNSKGQSTDGYIWSCKRCRRAKSIRQGSFFTGSHLSLEQLLLVIYCWTNDFPQKLIVKEAELGPAANHTVIDWCSFCRDICEQHLTDNPIEIGGLDPVTLLPRTVEIDESKYFHRKYHRGQWREGHWVFGGIERDTGRCFLVEVPDRTAPTLSALIER